MNSRKDLMESVNSGVGRLDVCLSGVVGGLGGFEGVVFSGTRSCGSTGLRVPGSGRRGLLNGEGIGLRGLGFTSAVTCESPLAQGLCCTSCGRLTCGSSTCSATSTPTSCAMAETASVGVDGAIFPFDHGLCRGEEAVMAGERDDDFPVSARGSSRPSVSATGSETTSVSVDSRAFREYLGADECTRTGNGLFEVLGGVVVDMSPDVAFSFGSNMRMFSCGLCC